MLDAAQKVETKILLFAKDDFQDRCRERWIGSAAVIEWSALRRVSWNIRAVACRRNEFRSCDDNIGINMGSVWTVTTWRSLATLEAPDHGVSSEICLS